MVLKLQSKPILWPRNRNITGTYTITPISTYSYRGRLPVWAHRCIIQQLEFDKSKIDVQCHSLGDVSDGLKPPLCDRCICSEPNEICLRPVQQKAYVTANYNSYIFLFEFIDKQTNLPNVASATVIRSHIRRSVYDRKFITVNRTALYFVWRNRIPFTPSVTSYRSASCAFVKPKTYTKQTAKSFLLFYFAVLFEKLNFFLFVCVCV